MLSLRASFGRNIRRYSTSVDHSIYLSDSTDPYFNLSLEDWLFRKKSPDAPLLFIYRDEPCVVIGRNQNPWKEVNFPVLHQRGIPFIRRRSGGGTVYHDLGNTNFSIHLPRTSFDRNVTGQIILRAVRALQVDAELNDRNDLCVRGDKVSGSAYKIVNKRAYHHGTMLISTHLETLGDLLRTDKASMNTKGVASVRSPVCNLQQHDPAITHESFSDAVVHAFREAFSDASPVQRVTAIESKNEDIRKGMSELTTWEWAYGQTPEFTYNINKHFTWGHVEAEIRAKHGVILSCHIPRFPSLGKSLEGSRYGVAHEASAQEEDGQTSDVRQWLTSVMAT
ncbi:Lipoyltransferase and lipoate-protein ligase [Hymenopellis radicata]|nr:Lipoyltransferase and lipoate-protein ligase [Hymenopellis radicata]